MLARALTILGGASKEGRDHGNQGPGLCNYKRWIFQSDTGILMDVTILHDCGLDGMFFVSFSCSFLGLLGYYIKLMATVQRYAAVMNE